MSRWPSLLQSRPSVAVVRLSGIITTGTRPGALNDAAVAPMIERAFRRGKPKAVALVINSPGGSPAQSSLIAARIRRLSKERSVPVHAFVEDVAASGGYWLAVAGDQIWVDENSIVGSIGVITATFGLDEFIRRHGVERRVYTSGKSKLMLDPFQPEKEEDVARLKALQEPIHATFIEHVRRRRGSRLATDRELFEGDIWVGQQAVDLGLADGVAHVVPKMKALYGDKVRFRPYGVKRGLMQRLGGGAADGALAALDERLAFARFGL